MNELKQLLKAIERLQSIVDCNKDVMDADDLGDLIANIEGLRTIYHNTYKKQIQQFVDYLNNTVEDEYWREWTETPYVISHGNKSVVVDNYADVYEAIGNLLEEHLKDLA